MLKVLIFYLIFAISSITNKVSLHHAKCKIIHKKLNDIEET